MALYRCKIDLEEWRQLIYTLNITRLSGAIFINSGGFVLQCCRSDMKRYGSDWNESSMLPTDFAKLQFSAFSDRNTIRWNPFLWLVETNSIASIRTTLTYRSVLFVSNHSYDSDLPHYLSCRRLSNRMLHMAAIVLSLSPLSSPLPSAEEEVVIRTTAAVPTEH